MIIIYIHHMKYYCIQPFTVFSIRPTVLYICCGSTSSVQFNALNSSREETNNHWFSESVQAFRRTIVDGTYSMCDKTKCPFLQDPEHAWCMKTKEEIQKDGDKEWATEMLRFIEVKDSYNLYPRSIALANDPSCNLKCIGCRKTVIKANDTKHAKKIENKFIDYIKNTTRISISGDGDPFASDYYFSLLKSDLTELNPNLNSIQLLSNGILFTPENWNLIHHNNRKLINLIDISIDACTPETYLAQRGGDFNVLCENLKFMSTIIQQNKYRILNTAFTITVLNYKEMGEFIRFADSFGFNRIYFWLMTDWSRGYSTSEYGVTRSKARYDDFLIKSNEAKKIALEYPHINIMFGF